MAFAAWVGQLLWRDAFEGAAETAADLDVVPCVVLEACYSYGRGVALA